MIKTFLFPGGSLKNKTWAEEMKARLEPALPVEIIYWSNWQEGQQSDNLDLPMEISKAVDLMANGEPFNILAKSIGTYVGLAAIEKSGYNPEKFVLCGIPFNIFNEEELKQYDILAKLPFDKTICFQNDNDPRGSYTEVQKLLASINPKIKVIMKEGDTHEYPYVEDFKNWLF